MKPSTQFSVLAVMGLAAAAVALDPAIAKSPHERQIVSTQKIDLTEFDLSRKTDAQELYDRIRRGARQVCRAHRQPRVLRRVSLYHECVTTAVEDAVNAVDHVNLTAIHEGPIPALAGR